MMPQWAKYLIAILAAHGAFLVLASCGVVSTDTRGRIRWGSGE